ncbi:MAG: ADP-ribosylglycohydrolase family protein [Muribaculaceae bacterium]|nr:ADP-ribosylglycohydrolase family protein [Muribaculaceae bacterium]
MCKTEGEAKRDKNVEAAKLVLLGAVCGDIVGSYYEGCSTKDYDFRPFTTYSRFTDDTVCSIGIADALIHDEPFEGRLQYWCRKYPRAGYGGMFRRWIYSDTMEPYNSWGNGSAMRVSAVGAYGNSLEEVMELAKRSAEVTHNHSEGIKGAQATAAAIYLALTGKSKSEIKSFIEERVGYDLSRRYDDIQPDYRFDVSCQGSVPESIICFLESKDYESAIRKAIAMGGDADTMAAITGGIAAAFYGEIPDNTLKECWDRLPEEMRKVIEKFNQKIG